MAKVKPRKNKTKALTSTTTNKDVVGGKKSNKQLVTIDQAYSTRFWNEFNFDSVKEQVKLFQLLKKRLAPIIRKMNVKDFVLTEEEDQILARYTDKKLAILKEVNKYSYPTQRAVESRGGNDKPITFNINTQPAPSEKPEDFIDIVVGGEGEKK